VLTIFYYLGVKPSNGTFLLNLFSEGDQFKTNFKFPKFSWIRVNLVFGIRLSKGEEVTNHLPNVTAASHADDREGGAVF
jgi:hypothetical protein